MMHIITALTFMGLLTLAVAILAYCGCHILKDLKDSL